MKTNELIELNNGSSKKGKRFLMSILVSLSLISFFLLFGSYQNPNIRQNNGFVKSSSNYFQNQIELQIAALNTINQVDTIGHFQTKFNELVVRFYKDRNYQPAWIGAYTLNQSFARYINLLDSAKYYGFPIDYFHTKEIKNLKKEIYSSTGQIVTLNSLMELEISTTYSVFKFMIYLKYGINDEISNPKYISFLESLPNHLNNALNQTNFLSEIISVQPNLIKHQQILTSLSFFIDLNLSIKYTSPAFIDDNLLAKSLFYTGITNKPQFDSSNTKANALYSLQNKYRLYNDSILNDSTHQIIVSLLQFKYYQACLNLNRLRKLEQTGDNYLFVNIPEFKLHVIESNKTKEIFNVIVGKKITPTPTLSSNIEKLVANPYWTIPRSILNNEMVQKIRKDSSYLKRNGFYVINGAEETVDESTINWNNNDPLGDQYWLRQKNSRSNALGQVKFFFPNEYSVYLHDTPSKNLFQNKNRSYSHGCIRLENPDKLAQYLTDRYNSASELNIQKLIADNEHYVIDLPEKIKIHIQYITCSGSDNFEIEFYNDIYDLDKKEINEIFPVQLEI